VAGTVVVQCFVKVDTLEGLCTSLLNCSRRDEFDLIFWSDSPNGSKRFEEYEQKNHEVLEFLQEYKRRFGGRFRSIEIHTNHTNLGTCKTCQVSMDYAFNKNDFVVFTEDDTIFAPDTLEWFLGLRDLGVLEDHNVLALAGESIYFDARNSLLPAGYSEQAQAAALSCGYLNKFTVFGFIPSSCFATTREKWEVFGAIRGQPRGDEDVCDFCKSEHKTCVFPIVGRVKDVGMLHVDGYSVILHGAANVKEVKNVYLLSSDLNQNLYQFQPTAAPVPEPFQGDRDKLFRETVLMQGFSDTVTPQADLKSLTQELVMPQSKPWKLWCFSMKNFGDALTPYILSHYKVPFELQERFEDANLIGIGSNLDRVQGNHNPIVVWTSGFMYEKSAPIVYSKAVRFLAVRGLHTLSSVEGLEKNGGLIGDGGLLVRQIFPFKQCKKRFRLGVMPHMSDKHSQVLRTIATDADVQVIDVFAPIDEVLFQIASCEMIISSSLHGIIVADAFDVPNAFGLFKDGRSLEGDGFKYNDYGSALGRSIEPLVLQEGVTVSHICEYIEGNWNACPNLDQIVDDLELTVEVLRAAARGLCSI
jgi:hypothetical protein